MGASVPSLGLSNKAVFEVETPETDSRHIKDMYPEHYFSPIALESPPAEETLMQNTLGCRGKPDPTHTVIRSGQLGCWE